MFVSFNPLNHPILLSAPRRLTPFSAWHGHIPFAMCLVDLLRPNRLVELGTHYGDSYCSFCQAVQQLELTTRCYAIDTWEGDSHTGFYGPEVLDDLRTHHDPLYGNFSRLVKSTFDDALQHFANASIDLLHIDGYHKYEVVMHDFQSWLPKMSSAGIILFHDTNVREKDFGIWKFWEEIKGQYPHFEFVHGHGLGVLAVGKESPVSLKTIFDATPEHALIIRNLFFQLGQRLESNIGQVAQLAAEREAFTRKLTELNATLNSTQLAVEEKQQALVQLGAQWDECLQENVHLRAIIQSQKAELDRGLDQVQTTLADSIRLRARIEGQEADLDRVIQEASQLRSVLAVNREALATIETSLGWKALSLYRQAKDKLLPVNTRRRLIYDRILAGIKGSARNLVGEGVNTSEVVPIFKYKLGGRENDIRAIRRLPKVQKFRVIFLVGCVDFGSKRYRVSNLIEALSLGGIEGEFFHDIDISTNLSHILSYDLIVLFRVAWTENVATLIRNAEVEGLPVIFDVDDYIFDPAIIPYVDGIRGWSADAIKQYEEGVLQYKKTFEHCSYFTAPTLFLKNQAARRGKKAFVIPNTVNTKQLRISQRAIQRRTKTARASEVIIGYFSGTRTHQKDFSSAYLALLRLLTEFHHVCIRIGGFLDLAEFPDLRRFGDRVECMPFVHWEMLPHVMAEIDINIIPLEVGNPFCDAKSELKYFESAILKIPSVASPTETFKHAIRHGENGLLALTTEDWYANLHSLILDEKLRLRIGTNAYEDSVARYTTMQLPVFLKNTYKDIISDFRRRNGFGESAISISFIVPLPRKGSGGHKDIFLIANHLKELGNKVVLFFIPGEDFGSAATLRDFIATEFCDPSFDIVLGVSVSPCDALIATHYSTAYLVREYASMAVRTFYFVQDYEPSFHPMGEEFIRAEQTYTFGFQCITLGPWLKGLLEKKYDIKCRSIPFWIERDIYYPRNLERKKSVAFFSRPEMPRRCFNLGLQALRLFHDMNPEVEIILFGSENIKHQSIPFKYTNLDILSKRSLAELYSQVTVGLAFSTTNPSFVGYEMMACGCLLLDVQLNKDYDYLKYGSSNNVVLVEPEPAKIAGVLGRLIGDSSQRAAITRNALTFIDSLPDIRTTASEFEAILRDCLFDNELVPHERANQTNGILRKQAYMTHCPSCASLQATQGRAITEFIDGERRSVINCDQCGFFFLFPRLPEVEIEHLEDDSEFKTMVNPEERIEGAGQVAQFVENFKPAKGSCLEIGCGNGYLLKALQMRGWKVVGLDISEAAVRNASALGVEAMQGTVEEVSLPLRTFDSIILWHVLEHIYAPRDFLCKLRGLIKIDGLLFVQVPNFAKLNEYRKANREKELLCAIHVNYFTVESLTQLAANAGWSMHSWYMDEKDHYLAAVLRTTETATDLGNN